MKCTVCGIEWPQDKVFCQRCGTKLESGAEKQQKQPAKWMGSIKDKLGALKKPEAQKTGELAPSEQPEKKTLSERFANVGKAFKRDKKRTEQRVAEPLPVDRPQQAAEPVRVPPMPEPAQKKPEPLRDGPIPPTQKVDPPAQKKTKQKSEQTIAQNKRADGAGDDAEKRKKPLNVLSFMALQFLMLIPVVNIALILRWAFCRDINRNHKNYAWAVIVWFLIVVAILVAVGVVFEGIYDPLFEATYKIVTSK